MPEFRSMEEYQKWKALRLQSFLHAQSKNGNARKSAQNKESLWFDAKQSFYYQDDILKASELCNQLIAVFALTEEADEAKLLLHDIRLENKKSGRLSANKKNIKPFKKKIIAPRHRPGKCLYCSKDFFARAEDCNRCGKLFHAGREDRNQPQEFTANSKIPLATAVVALPIIGIAKGGVIGIALPEILALLIIGSIFWGTAKIRDLLKRTPEQIILRNITRDA